jgi:multiple sugar transport system permease protein
MFGQALMVTQGAPANETRTAVMYIAQEGFRNFRLGSAAAMSYVLSIFLMALSVVVFWLFRRKKEDRV